MKFPASYLPPRSKLAPAVILFSGGLDSTTLLALAKELGYAPYALSVSYGQKHSSEIHAAKQIAAEIGVVRHEVIDIDLARFGGSALTDHNLVVPTTPGQATRFRVHAPIIHLTKAEIIGLGLSLGIDYAKTVSCYQANSAGEACGICESCRLRKMGFTQAGVVDPTRYAI